MLCIQVHCMWTTLAFLLLGWNKCLFSLEPLNLLFLLREWPAQSFCNEHLLIQLSSLPHVQKRLTINIQSKGAATPEFTLNSLSSVTRLSLSKIIVFKYLLTYWLAACSTSPPLRFAMPMNMGMLKYLKVINQAEKNLLDKIYSIFLPFIKRV